MNKRFFAVNTESYVEGTSYMVTRPSSLDKPKDDSVTFIVESNMDKAHVFENVSGCLIFWPEKVEPKERVAEHNAIVKCANPRLEFCRFFKRHGIETLPSRVPYEIIDGAFVASEAVIGKKVTIMPGAYIGAEVSIGDDVYIGAGVRLVGCVSIGNRVIIRENTVIGADGLTTDRDEDGKSVTLPQFGDVIIEDDVHIGANSVIARGAIDSTIIHSGCRIDNQCFISHNVEVGEDTFIVGETILFGSVSIGRNTMVSGNVTVRNGVHIGDKAIIGMGSVVVRSVADGTVVKGNPAR